MKILFIANTPFELYYLSSVACLLEEQDRSLESDLLIRPEIQDKITSEISSLYSEVKITNFPTLSSPFSRNPFKTVLNFFDNFIQTFAFRSYLKNLNFDYDVICISSFREFFANMICRHAPNNVRLVALRMANQRIETEGKYVKNPFLTFLSFLLNIKNFIFCYSTMRYMWRFDFEDIVVEKIFVKNPYNMTISIIDHNIGDYEDGRNCRLPPPFIALKKIYKTEDEAEGILVAGEPTLLHPSWGYRDSKKYQEFLDYLRENFKEYKLYFKPRMVFKNMEGQLLTDVNTYNLEGFEIIPARNSFEEVCLKKNIKKVISIMSTASKVGAYFGISSYILYTIFGLSDYFKSFIEFYFDDMDSIIRVNKFEDLMINPDIFIKKYNFETLSTLYWEAIYGRKNKNRPI